MGAAVWQNVDVEQGANRSQLPFLSHFTRLIYENTGDKTFLAQMVSVLKDEYLFWMTDRAGAVPGLNRFSHSATNDYLTDFYMGTLCPRLGFDPNASEEEKFCVASHYLAEAESTADFTSRFLGRAGDFLAIDLNANLYGYETNFAWFAQELASAEAAPFAASAGTICCVFYGFNFARNSPSLVSTSCSMDQPHSLAFIDKVPKSTCSQRIQGPKFPS